MEKLSPTERETHLQPLLLAGWEIVEGRDALKKTFKFKNFRQAFAWMTEIALWAEKMDHHPEWSNVYNEVIVTLQTHTANGLTTLDTKLANRMDSARTTA